MNVLKFLSWLISWNFTLILIFGWILQVFYVPFLSSFYLQNGGYLMETNVEWTHSYTNNGENNLSKDAQIVTQNTPNTCNIYHKLKVKVNFKVSEVWMNLLLHACCCNENSQLISPCCLHSVVYSKLQPAQGFIKWLKYLVCVSNFSLPCFPF